MKLALICPYSITKGGGVQEIIYALYPRLSRQHDVRIITPHPKDFDGDGLALAQKTWPDIEFTDETQPFIFVGNGRDITLRSLKTTGQISGGEKAAVREILERENFDVMHFHEPWVPFLSAQLLQENAKREKPALAVATFHAKLPESIRARTFSQIARPYTKPILQYIDVLTAVSPAASHMLSKLTKREIYIIPNGIDLKKFMKPDQENRGQTILYVGRLEGRKGLKHLIAAFAKIVAKNPDAKLLLAGGGVDREKLENYVYYEKVPNVEFLGRIPESQKLELLGNCGVFCSPALYGESFGIVLLEAMACGAPIVAGNNPGYASVMTDLGEISLVNPRHHDDFARRLEIMMREPILRQTWQNWAENEIVRYDYDRIAKLYEEVYES